MQRQPRIYDKDHLQFIRELSCVACGDNTSTEAAHVKQADRRAAKRSIGAGEKAHDRWTVPLCGRCHHKQHEVGETIFWDAHSIDPVFLCLALWGVTGEHELGEQIVRAHQPVSV